MSCMGLLAMSTDSKAFAAACEFGQTPGFLSGRNSVSTSMPCSRIVDAERGCFAETDRAKMAGDFDAVGVRGFDGGSQFVWRDIHVCLERSGAARDPEFDHLARVFRVLQLMHLQCKGAFTFEIWAGDVDFRTPEFARIDRLLEFKISVWFKAASRSNRSDAACEIETRKT